MKVFYLEWPFVILQDFGDFLQDSLKPNPHRWGRQNRGPGMGDFWGEPGTISPDPGSKIRVAFNGVSFRYGLEQPLVLRNVSFSAEPGERIVLTGHSGAGKTTCINLLMRYWDVSEGSITLNGEDIISWMC